MFELCCSHKKETKYSIIHKPVPIPLSADWDVIIKRLLWYVPNIDSHQSPQDIIIGDIKIYNDILFNYLLEAMGIDKEKDIKILPSEKCIDDSEWNYYEKKICLSCQKIIITAYENKSKTANLLRCIRNCIAHGDYILIDDYLIGLNRHKTKKHPEGEKKAIIKIKPKLLLSALDSLSTNFIDPEKTKRAIIACALQQHGYTVLVDYPIILNPESKKRIIADLVAEKNGKQYIVEIKSIDKPYVHDEHIAEWINTIKKYRNDVTFVLMMDSSRLTNEAKNAVQSIPNCVIMGTTEIKNMLIESSEDLLAQDNQTD